MTIRNWQDTVDQWISTIGVRYFDEMTNLAVLMEETGELARMMSRKYGEQSFKEPMTDEEVKMEIKEELADIIFVTTCLANQMNIDLEEALSENIKRKTARDQFRHRDNEKLQ